jgi:glycosyltransferase involved in cell wall biosynthesis
MPEVNTSGDTLYIVMPAYNEAATIAQVAREWHTVLTACGGPASRLLILDDGSTDQTWAILCDLQTQLPRLLSRTGPNRGHGPTIRAGYALALEQGADYIFQTDSDGQPEPGEFSCLWRARSRYAAQISRRVHRGDGPARVFVARVLRLCLWLTFGVRVTDANTPFRLLQRDTLAACLPRIPEQAFLTNALMAALLARDRVPVRYVPITFHPRRAGKNTIRLSRIVPVGWRALREFRQVRRQL